MRLALIGLVLGCLAASCGRHTGLPASEPARAGPGPATPGRAAEGTVDPLRRTAPPGIHLESVAYDPGRGRLVVFGGGRPSGEGPPTFPGETWEWDGRRWEVAADSGAGPGWRVAAAMTYDPASRRIVLFGGIREDGRGGPAEMLCDLWAYDGSWTRLPGGPCVTGRSAGASLVAGAGGSLLLVDGLPQPPADTAGTPLRIWRRAEGGWVLVDSAGPRRYGSGHVAFDQARSALVVPVFEGPDAGVWEWAGGRWQRHAASGPVPRSRFPLVYDPRSKRVLLLGGLALAPREALGDVWAWDGRSWAEASERGGAPAAPPGRTNATLLWDGAGDRLLLFGGSRDGRLLEELWIHDRRGWWAWIPDA